jgi:excisionase family DNA binding protein
MTQLITQKEASERLGIHRTTLHRWIKAGHLKVVPVMPTGHPMLKADDIDAIAASRRGED